jgi:hypothetical protein
VAQTLARGQLALLMLAIDLVRTTAETKLVFEMLEFAGEFA